MGYAAGKQADRFKFLDLHLFFLSSLELFKHLEFSDILGTRTML